MIGTGCGRISMPFIDKAVTGITCHARGAHHLLEGADMVFDIINLFIHPLANKLIK